MLEMNYGRTTRSAMLRVLSCCSLFLVVSGTVLAR
jgi:hypothetical protein